VSDTFPIAKMLWSYRTLERMGVRELAKEAGISAATLSRIENGHMMDAKTLTTLTVWMLGLRNKP
jgi:transcriptional regulator with XRE-family HTH domain